MKKSINELTHDAIERYKTLLGMWKKKNEDMWLEGEQLYFLKRDKEYKYVFGDSGSQHNVDSWRAFIEQTPIPFSTAEMRVRLYESYIVDWKVSLEKLKGLNTRSLDRAIPYIKGKKQELDEALDYAKELPFSEFLKWLNGNKEPCWHQKRIKKTKEVAVCKDCGKELKVAELKEK